MLLALDSLGLDDLESIDPKFLIVFSCREGTAAEDLRVDNQLVVVLHNVPSPNASCNLKQAAVRAYTHQKQEAPTPNATGAVFEI